jgi:hypothetical protein
MDYIHNAGTPLSVDYIHNAGTPLYVDYIHNVGTPLSVDNIHNTGIPLSVDYFHNAGTPFLWIISTISVHIVPWSWLIFVISTFRCKTMYFCIFSDLHNCHSVSDVGQSMDQRISNDVDSVQIKSEGITLRRIQTNNQLRYEINQYKQMDKGQDYRNRVNIDNIGQTRMNYEFDDDDWYTYMEIDKDQHKRSGRHKRSTENKGFLDDPNNVAMFIVFPVMVFIYGGCAVLYCCYKCKNYVNENQPFAKLKEKIKNKGKNTETIENRVDAEGITDISNEAHVEIATPPRSTKPEVRVFERQVFKPNIQSRSQSATSNPDTKVTCVDVEYEDEVNSTMSTPLPLSDDINEEAETYTTSDSHVATDTSTQSFPSLSTVSTRVSTVNERESPLHKSVSVQSDSSQVLYTSFPKVCLVDMACQTDDTPPDTISMFKPLSIRSKINKVVNRKKQSTRKMSAKLGQIHYVENYVSLNPYRDQVEEEYILRSHSRNMKGNLNEAFEEAVIQTIDRKKRRRKRSTTPDE